MQPQKSRKGIPPRHTWRLQRLHALVEEICRLGDYSMFEGEMVDYCEELAAMCRTSMVTVEPTYDGQRTARNRAEWPDGEQSEIGCSGHD